MISAIINFDNWKCGDSVEAITFALLKNKAPLTSTGSLINAISEKKTASGRRKLTTENSGGITILNAVTVHLGNDEIKSYKWKRNLHYDIE
jgi:hypothetical protein